MPIVYDRNMDISIDEIQAAFGRVNASKTGEKLAGGLYQVLFLPSAIESHGSATHYTAFCPFTGITGRGTTLSQAYKSWLAEALSLFTSEVRSQTLSNDNPLQCDNPLQHEELVSRKLCVGEIQIASKPAAPVFVIDFGEREVVVCPFKSEVGTAEKNTTTPVITTEGKEMKVPGFLVDQRVPCTKIRRFNFSACYTSTTVSTAI